MRKFYIFFTIALLAYIIGITIYLLFSPSSLPPDWTGTAADPATFMTAEQLEKSFSYSRIRNVISFINGPLEWGIYLLILGIGLSAALRRWVQPMRWNLLKIFFFLLLLSLITTILHFPLDYYVFQLKHQYGITSQPFANWMGDNVKSFVISLVITTPLIWLLYFIVQKSPKRWWLWLWGLSIPITLFFMYVQPVVLDPIYNDFYPLKDQELKREILTMAEKANIPTDQVYEVDMSKKTNALNAYVNGIGSNTRIVLWDTTLQKLKKDEVLFIMAHEMGHFALHHMTWLFIGSVFSLLIVLYLLSLSLKWVIARCGRYWGISGAGDLASLPVILLLLSIISFVSTPIQNAVSRQYEQAADEYAMSMTHNKDTAVRTFQRLAVEGLSEVNPPGLVKFMVYTHPTLYERILFVQEFKE